MPKHNCIAFVSPDINGDKCKNEAVHPTKKESVQLFGEVHNPRYCESHWNNLLKCNTQFPCIFVEAKYEGDKVVGCPYFAGNKLVEEPCPYESITEPLKNNKKLKKSVRNTRAYKVSSPKPGSPIRPGSPRPDSPKISGGLVYPASGAFSPKISAPVSPKVPKTPMLAPVFGDEDDEISHKKAKKRKEEEYESEEDEESEYESEEDEESEYESEEDEEETTTKKSRYAIPTKDKRKHTSSSSLPRKTMRRPPRVFPNEIREYDLPAFMLRKPSKKFVEALNVIDTSGNLEEVKKAIKLVVEDIRNYRGNTVLADGTKKPYSFNVEERVATEFSKIMARYMYNPIRVELLLSYLFDYESRDLSLTFSYFGFRGNSGTLQNEMNTANPDYTTPQPVFNYKFGSQISLKTTVLPMFGETSEENRRRAAKILQIATDFGLTSKDNDYKNLTNQVNKTGAFEINALIKNAKAVFDKVNKVKEKAEQGIIETETSGKTRDSKGDGSLKGAVDVALDTFNKYIEETDIDLSNIIQQLESPKDNNNLEGFNKDYITKLGRITSNTSFKDRAKLALQAINDLYGQWLDNKKKDLQDAYNSIINNANDKTKLENALFSARDKINDDDIKSNITDDFKSGGSTTKSPGADKKKKGDTSSPGGSGGELSDLVATKLGGSGGEYKNLNKLKDDTKNKLKNIVNKINDSNKNNYRKPFKFLNWVSSKTQNLKDDSKKSFYQNIANFIAELEKDSPSIDTLNKFRTEIVKVDNYTSNPGNATTLS